MSVITARQQYRVELGVKIIAIRNELFDLRTSVLIGGPEVAAIDRMLEDLGDIFQHVNPPIKGDPK